MNLLAHTNANNFTIEIEKLFNMPLNFEEYDTLTLPGRYYLWVVSKNKKLALEVHRGEIVHRKWQKVTLFEIAKIGSALFDQIETSKLSYFATVFASLKAHFLDSHAEPEGLLTAISFLDRTHIKIKRLNMQIRAIEAEKARKYDPFALPNKPNPRFANLKIPAHP